MIRYKNNAQQMWIILAFSKVLTSTTIIHFFIFERFSSPTECLTTIYKQKV